MAYVPVGLYRLGARVAGLESARGEVGKKARSNRLAYFDQIQSLQHPYEMQRYTIQKHATAKIESWVQ